MKTATSTALRPFQLLFLVWIIHQQVATYVKRCQDVVGMSGVLLVAAEEGDIEQQPVTDDENSMTEEEELTVAANTDNINSTAATIEQEQEGEGYKSASTIYVIDPFEVVDEDWRINGNSSLEIETTDVKFGRGAMKVVLSFSESSQPLAVSSTVGDDSGDVITAEDGDTVGGVGNVQSTAMATSSEVSFGWILETPNWTYNCFGATDVSIWYRPVNTTGHEIVRVVFYDDTPCLLTYAEDNDGEKLSSCVKNESSLDRYVVLERTLPLTTNTAEQWREVKVPINSESLPMDLRRLRGWKIEVAQADVGTGTDNKPTKDSVILFDQLSCIGGGDMFGSVFTTGEWVDFDRKQLEQSSAVNPIDQYWYYSFYQSEVSATNTNISLSRSGQLSIDYTVQKVEEWGGFVEVGHICPGNAYYNVSTATDIQVTYDISRVASEEGRAIFRLVLQDVSDCSDGCEVDGFQSERYYSFNPILDDMTTNGSQDLIIPLVGGDTPDNPFWLTGWSGISGNSKLDTSQLKGFFLEVVLDSQLEMGNLVVGQVQFRNMTMLTSFRSNGSGTSTSQQAVNDQCREDPLLYLAEPMPTFKRFEFLGSECCDICISDPECLYAYSSGRDCFVAGEIDPDYMSLVSWEQFAGEQMFWVDSADKRGDFCDVCQCREEDHSIDCRGRDLVILPKTFTPMIEFSPKRLDLRDNLRLQVIGAGSLESIEDTLEEILFPAQVKHITAGFFKTFPLLNKVQFEDTTTPQNDGALHSANFITAPDGAFSSKCCSRGDKVDFESSGVQVVFCDMRLSTPGIDSVYFPFTKYPDESPPMAFIQPSSTFMSEAAESVEKCAEYCAISSDCRYFMYDARYPNAEHSCVLYKTLAGPAEPKCCDQDDYADLSRTLPGLTTGIPPRTRHDTSSSRVIFPDSEYLALGPHNDFSLEYSLSLGSDPIRGAVWIEPSVQTEGFDVEISPRKVVFYDSTETATVKVTIRNFDEVLRPTMMIVHSIEACDVAFLETQDTVVYVDVQQERNDINLAILVPGVLVFVLLIALLIAFIFYLRKRAHEESIWKVEKEELEFDSPPIILGRGTFGLVLLASYRGTKVAVKRAVPPKNNKSIHFSMMDLSSEELGAEKGQESGSSSAALEGSGSFGVRRSFHFALSSFRKNTSQNPLSSSARNFDRLKSDFVEEMKILSRLRHPCITTVMGGVLSKDVEPMLVMEYMEHGSLYDLLHNETFVLEGDVVLTILRDISQGLRFLHVAEPQVIHGDLKAANILVDQKFRAKVADFGLSQKQRLGATGTPFWMAPELLRSPEMTNTASSDIYAFGIILYEVYSRSDPYLEEDEDTRTILRKIADEGKRPPIPSSSPAEVQSLMTSCLMNDPSQRPTAEEIDIRLRRAVAAQVAPQKEVQMSLFDMFPPHIAKALEEGRDIEPEHRDEVTIFFSDIVGFTTLSSTMPPRKVAKMLDRLYNHFDELSAKHDLYKVETIGDAYLAVTNLVKDQSHDHCKRVAEFAIDAVKAANSTMIDLDDETKGCVEIRVGFHSGPIVADVVGHRNKKYTLFGDTINTASRMESTSKTNKIQCSEASALILKRQSPFLPLKSRGIRPIKGKGLMKTFWVNEGSSSSYASSEFRRRNTSPDDFAMLRWAGQVVEELGIEELDNESDIENCSRTKDDTADTAIVQSDETIDNGAVSDTPSTDEEAAKTQQHSILSSQDDVTNSSTRISRRVSFNPQLLSNFTKDNNFVDDDVV